MDEERFWICQRCGNLTDGQPANLSHICPDCLELTLDKVSSTNMYWFLKMVYIVVSVLSATLLLVLWVFLKKPEANEPLTTTELIVSLCVMGLIVLKGVYDPCPICKKYIRNYYYCEHCDIQYRE